MSQKTTRTTRRGFLQQITVAAALSTPDTANIGGRNAQGRDRSHFRVFTEGRIGSLQIKNRFVRAAALERAASNGQPTEIYLKMMETLAAGGIGMIITGAMAAALPGLFTQIFAFEDRHVAGLKRIPEVVHATEKTCRVIAQVVCFGDAGPSGIPWQKTDSVRALSVEEIEDVVRQFAESIRRFRDAGFDGAELNGHFVYLLSSFLSPLTNKRSDKYGGSVENRVRIIREIVDQARAKVGPDFPIMIKVNCDDSFFAGESSEEGTNLSNFHILAAEIAKAGIDAIEISGNSLLRTKMKTSEDEPYFLKHAETLHVGIPVVLTGGNRSIDRLDEIHERGKVDFFGMARPLIREPNLVRQWREGGGTGRARCISCNRCFSAKGPLRCVEESKPGRSA